MTKLASRGPRAAATSLALFIAFVAALLFPATGLAEEEALLAFSPAPVGFAKTTAGTESQGQMVDVHNVSSGVVAIDQVVVEGADSGDFKLMTGGGCGWLDPDQHCSFWVAFAPGSAGAKTATLALKLKEAPEQTAQLQGEAVPPQLAFTPGSLDFGIQRVNRAEGSGSVQLTNVGEAATQLNSIGISGPNSNNFWTGGDCWNGRWLQSGESCTVQVGFNPWDTVSYEAELQAYVNGATFDAALSGFGGRPIIEAANNPTEFGAVPVGSVGPVQEVSLGNSGNLTSSFFIAVIAGGSVGSFQLVDEDCTAAPLDPDTTCTVYVRFAPLTTGPKSARLALFGDDEGGAMVMLTGEGLPALPTPAVTSAAGPGTAASSAPPRSARAKHRRFGRNASLSARRAHCLTAPCRKAKVLRGRSVASGD
ncbi:MAG TPA: choice-of-anchor D domain-containing protein [Solirubrobacterales bacterium]|nr:choice-of-anchor D domain-containing protein [Solirubrobacterales bacterium]